VERRWILAATCSTPPVRSVVGLIKHHQWLVPNKKPDVDAAMWVELAYPGGIRGRLHWDMNAQGRQMVWTVIGTAATAVVPAFAVPHLDNRIVITRDGSTEEQTLGAQTSYTYQLAALADTLQTGAEFLIDVDDSVANAELIDEVYLRAGLSPRG